MASQDLRTSRHCHGAMASALFRMGKREVPEVLKPRRIEIRGDESQNVLRGTRQIEAPKAA